MAERFAVEMLEETIVTEFKKLSSLPDGSDEKTAVIDNLVKLYKLKIEENKFAVEARNNESHERLEKRRISEQIKDRYFRVGTAAAELLLPLMFYGVWMNKGFEFEKTGNFTSSTFRGLFRYFKPAKK